uniref:Uncharacterized protein n=1 Tax=Oryza meridionalis TaxID=40149 RepID=A0A0E0CBY7_9ORYZ
MSKLAILGRSSGLPRSNEGMRLLFSAVIGVMLGYLFGISFPTVNVTKLHFPSSIISYIEDKDSGITTQTLLNHAWTSANSKKRNNSESNSDEIPKDHTSQPRYLITFTVGYSQKANIDAAVKKKTSQLCCSTMMVGLLTGMNLSGQKGPFMWYAKRFLHPDIVAPYDYIFIWDEDLSVQHFNAEAYIKLVRKHGLEISQPGLEPDRGLTWQMTKRLGDQEVHKVTEERPGWCTDPHLPPCAAFVEIMATVFSRDAWRCNDLVHGWGLDFALRRCVEPAHEKIGVVDSQWIIHQVIPSLGNQGTAENGRTPWEGRS